MGETVKRILDSVHGYIIVPDSCIKNIIDSEYFQRLRRIEQTSGRSIFPSARHDRFIHSLGVFHIGTQILESLERRKQVDKDSLNYQRIAVSYEFACLLHDVGHTPFSHTFEDYYKNSYNKLDKRLKDLMNAYDPEFNKDFENQYKEAAPHEKISAIVAIEVFGQFVNQQHQEPMYPVNGDIGLVARMIVGCKYLSNGHDLKNVFIELMHSKTIDADGLDYVCRDAWASGYRTSQVDMQRLIDAIMIKETDGILNVCFSVKAINEIRSVIFVKNFQQDNVITHRTVVYEQELLKKAMESAAIYYWELSETDDEVQRSSALENLCNIDSYFNGIKTKRDKLPICLPMDDDFIYLMKTSKGNHYANEWMSRNYVLKPLWKSRERFMSYFIKFKHELFNESCWLFSDHCKEYISEKFNVDINKIWVVKALPKNKMASLKDLLLLVKDDVMPYTALYPKETLLTTCMLPHFCYIFIPPKDRDGEVLDFTEIQASVRQQFMELK